MTFFRTVVYVGILVFSARFYGQVAALPEVGVNLNKSYSGGDIDHIELQNGNLYADIPIVAFPQLGKLALSFSLRANGSSWSLNAPCDSEGDCDLFYSTVDAPDSCLGGTNVGGMQGFGNASVELVMDQALDFCSAHDLLP
jgi:hypothetical protein